VRTAQDKVAINVLVSRARHRDARLRAVARSLSWEQVIDQALELWIRAARSAKGIGDIVLVRRRS